MTYSHEVEHMCVVKKGPNHGPAPIPEEGKWVKSKEIKELFKTLENEKIPLFNERQKEIAIYNIILNYLSEYLINSKEIIKELPKSMIKQRKWYEF